MAKPLDEKPPEIPMTGYEEPLVVTLSIERPPSQTGVAETRALGFKIYPEMTPGQIKTMLEHLVRSAQYTLGIL